MLQGSVIALYINSSSKPQESLVFEQQGVVGDRHYAKNIDRSVLISSLESYAIAIDKDIAIEVGALGENILISFNPCRLNVGSLLHIGDVVLEITQQGTLCQHLSAIDKRLPKLLKNDRGIFAKVIKEGKIKVGDKIEVSKVQN